MGFSFSSTQLSYITFLSWLLTNPNDGKGLNFINSESKKSDILKSWNRWIHVFQSRWTEMCAQSAHNPIVILAKRSIQHPHQHHHHHHRHHHHHHYDHHHHHYHHHCHHHHHRHRHHASMLTLQRACLLLQRLPSGRVRRVLRRHHQQPHQDQQRSDLQ